ncbi:hypothetical protein AB0L86_10760 [Micromonospora musae]|uniref:hypothetical protein n=1 Tax=Micromonospora musae TaxID=1894970 RepID=UPI00343C7527
MPGEDAAVGDVAAFLGGEPVGEAGRPFGAAQRAEAAEQLDAVTVSATAQTERTIAPSPLRASTPNPPIATASSVVRYPDNTNGRRDSGEGERSSRSTIEAPPAGMLMAHRTLSVFGLAKTP